jgi:hypothetical protein
MCGKILPFCGILALALLLLGTLFGLGILAGFWDKPDLTRNYEADLQNETATNL